MHSSLLFLIFISFSSLTLAGSPFAVYLCSLNYPVNTVLTFAGDAVTGLLTKANTYSTGGCGYANGNSTLPAQGVISVIGRFLFVVNPASNTITQFLISALDPTVLVRIGIFNTGGHFPTACGGFSRNGKNVVCAVNSGQINGVRCWNFNTLGLQLIVGGDRLLDLNVNVNVGPIFSTLSQILFLLDGSAFCILSKDPVGSLLMYTFDLLTCLPALDGLLAPVVNTINYAGCIDPRDGSLFVVDNIGARLVSITHGLTALLPSLFPLHLNIGGPCWVDHSILTGLFYVTNRLTGCIHVISRGLLGILNLDLTINLHLDVLGIHINAVADIHSVVVGGRNFLYANCPNARIIVGLDLLDGAIPIIGRCNTGSTSYHATGMCSYVPPQIGK